MSSNAGPSPAEVQSTQPAPGASLLDVHPHTAPSFPWAFRASGIHSGRYNQSASGACRSGRGARPCGNSSWHGQANNRVSAWRVGPHHLVARILSCHTPPGPELGKPHDTSCLGSRGHPLLPALMTQVAMSRTTSVRSSRAHALATCGKSAVESKPAPDKLVR